MTGLRNEMDVQVQGARLPRARPDRGVGGVGRRLRRGRGRPTARRGGASGMSSSILDASLEAVISAANRRR